MDWSATKTACWPQAVIHKRLAQLTNASVWSENRTACIEQPDNDDYSINNACLTVKWALFHWKNHATRVVGGISNATVPEPPAWNARRRACNVSTKGPSVGYRALLYVEPWKVDHMRTHLFHHRLLVRLRCVLCRLTCHNIQMDRRAWFPHPPDHRYRSR